MAVSFTEWVKSHLAVERLDYSEVQAFVLAQGLRKCSYLRMPWDFWLIFLALGVLLPWRGRARMKKLLAMPVVGTLERLVLYASTITFQWLAVTVVAWRLWIHKYSAGQLGLAVPDRLEIALASLAGALAIAAMQWLNLRRIGRIPVQSRGPLQAIAERILPQSSVELLPYLALAITAGVCEEFLYRGFVIAALSGFGLPGWSQVLISSLLFGLEHSYQGRGGMVMTLFVGLVFGVSRLSYHSLVPAIFWHSAADAVAGVAGMRYLLMRTASPNLTAGV